MVTDSSDSGQPLSGTREENEMKLRGVTLRRDALGVIHIEGGPVDAKWCTFQDDMEDGPFAFCIHDGGDGCPGESDQNNGYFGKWFRFFGSIDAGIFRD